MYQFKSGMPHQFTCGCGGTEYTIDSKSIAFGIGGSNPSYRTILYSCGGTEYTIDLGSIAFEDWEFKSLQLYHFFVELFTSKV